MNRLLTAIALLVAMLTTDLSAQDAGAVLSAVSKAMGAENVRSITYSGSASTLAILGQSKSMNGPWPLNPVRKYTRTIDFQQPASLATGTIWQSAILVGGPPQPDPYLQQVRPTNTAWAQQLEVWVTPWGFLKGAADNRATVRSQKSGGKAYTVVSWTPPQKAPSGAAYTVNGYIDDRNMIDRVETWLEHDVLGDTHIEVSYRDYRDFGGVKVPTTVVQKRFGWPVFEGTITSASANPTNLAQLLQPPPRPQVPPLTYPPPQAEKLAEGVYRILGDHIALVVEMKDHVVVLEGGAENEARGLAVIAETRKVIPNKPIRYMVNLHAHFDHSGGLGPFVAEGITILTHENNLPFLETALGMPRTLLGDAMAKSGKKAKIESMGAKKVLQDGTRTIELHHIRDNEHTDGILVAYLPKEKILFQGDFSLPLGGRGVDRTRPGQSNEWIFNLVDNFDRLNLWDFERFVPVHPPEPDAPWTKADVLRSVGRAD